MKTVQELKKAGYTAHVVHLRVLNQTNRRRNALFGTLPKGAGDHTYVNPRGGITQVSITTPDGRELFGEAECSFEDNYNKKRGVAIAIGRALTKGGE